MPEIWNRKRVKDSSTYDMKLKEKMGGVKVRMGSGRQGEERDNQNQVYIKMQKKKIKVRDGKLAQFDHPIIYTNMNISYYTPEYIELLSMKANICQAWQ